MTSATTLDEKLEALGYYFVEEKRRKQPSESDLQELKARTGHSLPDDYEAFLLKYGLSALGDEGYVECATAERCPWGGLTTDVFYGFTDRQSSRDVREAYDAYQGRMPPNLLPIGSDPGGNQVCISLSGDDRGFVYFWDHEHKELGGIERLDEMCKQLEEAGLDTKRLGIDQAVYEWEKRHEDTLKKPPGYSNVYLIARSFADFIQELELRPYEDG